MSAPNEVSKINCTIRNSITHELQSVMSKYADHGLQIDFEEQNIRDHQFEIKLSVKVSGYVSNEMKLLLESLPKYNLTESDVQTHFPINGSFFKLVGHRLGRAKKNVFLIQELGGDNVSVTDLHTIRSGLGRVKAAKDMLGVEKLNDKYMTVMFMDLVECIQLSIVNIPKDFLQKSIDVNGKKYRIIGYASKRSKFPILLENVVDGSQVFFKKNDIENICKLASKQD